MHIGWDRTVTLFHIRRVEGPNLLPPPLPMGPVYFIVLESGVFTASGISNYGNDFISL